MIIPDWLTRRIAIIAIIFMEIFALKGYFPGKWGILSFIILMFLWYPVLRPKTIRIAGKNQE